MYQYFRTVIKITYKKPCVKFFKLPIYDYAKNLLSIFIEKSEQFQNFKYKYKYK